MTFTIPHPNSITRLLIIITGVTILIWSGFEDSNAIGVTILGWAVALVSITGFILSRFGGLPLKIPVLIKLSPLVGAIIGAWATLCVVLLMLFKNIRHAHVFPDYPPQMMLDTLSRLPFWTVSGGLIAVGIVLLWTLHPTNYLDKGDTNLTD